MTTTWTTRDDEESDESDFSESMATEGVGGVGGDDSDDDLSEREKAPQQQAKMERIRWDRYYFGLGRRLRQLVARSSNTTVEIRTLLWETTGVDKWLRRRQGHLEMTCLP